MSYYGVDKSGARVGHDGLFGAVRYENQTGALLLVKDAVLGFIAKESK